MALIRGWGMLYIGYGNTLLASSGFVSIRAAAIRRRSMRDVDPGKER